MIAPDGAPLPLRGISLGNWLVPEGYMFGFDTATSPRQIRQVFSELLGEEAANAFWSQWREDFVSADDVNDIKRMGLNLIRVPFDYRDFTPEEYPEVWVDQGFRYIDRIVEWSARNGLLVLLDMHAAPCGQTGSNIDNSYGYQHLFDDPRCAERMSRIWRHIAEHYASSTTVIGYELLNEPMPFVQGETPNLAGLNEVYKKVSDSIKEVDAKHALFLEGANWGLSFQNFEQAPLIDRAVYVFHYYWSDPTEEGIRQYLDFRDRFRVPMLMDESGENMDQWVREFRTLLEAHKVGWSFWPYKKLSAPNSIRTYPAPRYWDEIVAYQKLMDAPQSERRKIKPQREHVLSALNELLESIKYRNSSVNAGFISALGLAP
ncbi:glycoside hydrolase family 5 protein [Methylobacterium sp. P31]